MRGLSSIVTASLLALRLFSHDVAAAPGVEVEIDLQNDAVATPAAGSWWLPQITRNSTIAYSDNPNFQIYRNVKDFGAKGDGVTDDTAAINQAISSGQRCGNGCDSTTLSPAIVYFPAGTYLVSNPIILYYYTHMIGDPTNLPVLKAAPQFSGIAVIDSDPYLPGGANWYTNQNNFFRQVRNFRIDLRAQPISTGTGIHWQVAQATSLQNIVFDMNPDPSSNNKQQGIFMDNGSGGFMTDLTFNGGGIGAFLGNQQFTTRNMVFNGCRTAIYMNWNWVWTFGGVTINNANIGIDMSAGGQVQAVGSVIVLDTKISNTAVGVLTGYHPGQEWSNSTLILDNVDMSTNTPIAVKSSNDNSVILPGNKVVASFVQGHSYVGGNTKGQDVQAARPAVSKPSALLDSKGRVVAKSKPQYADVDVSKFVSVKGVGHAVGNGRVDDTKQIQAFFDKLGPDQIAYFDHGAYLITDTIRVPKDIKIVGEIWPIIVADGDSFNDEKNPKPVWQVGQPGDVGNVEIQDLIFQTRGPAPGAIMMEFNVAGASPASAGLFDVHFRIGGSAGTGLQSDKCTKTPDVLSGPNTKCIGAFLLLHITASASAYIENVWAWVADHELDLGDHNQISIYNGRGMLIESTKGTWIWGSAAEHSTMVNFNVVGAKNVFIGLAQTETAYFQGNPNALLPFTPNPKYGDPTFANCGGTAACIKTWGLRVISSQDVFVYGGGLYSFFENYNQDCVAANNCQANMIDIGNSTASLFGINTKASVNMITYNNAPAALDRDNRNNFCAGVAAFTAS